MKKYIIVLFTLVCSACLRSSDSVLPVTHSQPFKNGNIVRALQAQTNLSLFIQAFNRLNLGAQLDSSRGYTIFAPTDSAMQVAGLDANTINSLSIDSLRRVIAYHILDGTLNDQGMTNTNLSLLATTLRQDTSFDQATGHRVVSTQMYLQERDAFYVNGFPAPKASGVVEASNGNIFPITRVLYAFTYKNTLDVINTQSDLSLFAAAIRISDSVKDDYFTNYWGDNLEDSDPYGLPSYWLSHPPNTFLSYGYQPTILAPTNTAFNKAGIYTEDDLRQLATSQPIGFNDDFTAYVYSPTDTLIGRHILFNNDIALKNQLVRSISLYNDMLSPNINNGKYNVDWGLTTNYWFLEPYNLKLLTGLAFSDNNGIVNVKWNGVEVPVPLDPDMRNPTMNFVTQYGAVYKIDQLFK